MIARDDSLVVLLSAGSDPQVFTLDSAGQASPPREMPHPARTSTYLTQLALAPNGDILVVGAIIGVGVPTRAGVWRLDGSHAPVAGFTDGSFGVAGFATVVTSPYSDAVGADAVVRADGSILALVYSQMGQVLTTYELTSSGAPLIDQMHPELASST